MGLRLLVAVAFTLQLIMCLYTVNGVYYRHEYVGCYPDSAWRTLDGYYSLLYSLATLELCQSVCYRAGFEYFGTEAPSLCLCGNEILERNGGPLPEEECNSTCNGDSSQICGGDWRISIYKVQKNSYKTFNKVYLPQYVGCYPDAFSRTLTGYFNKKVRNIMTLELCQAFCVEAGFIYFGLQASCECCCGNYILDRNGDSRPEEECNEVCEGDSSQICGGAWRLSIYRTNLMGVTATFVQQENFTQIRELAEERVRTQGECSHVCLDETFCIGFRFFSSNRMCVTYASDCSSESQLFDIMITFDRFSPGSC